MSSNKCEIFIRFYVNEFLGYPGYHTLSMKFATAEGFYFQCQFVYRNKTLTQQGREQGQLSRTFYWCTRQPSDFAYQVRMYVVLSKENVCYL